MILFQILFLDKYVLVTSNPGDVLLAAESPASTSHRCTTCKTPGQRPTPLPTADANRPWPLTSDDAAASRDGVCEAPLLFRLLALRRAALSPRPGHPRNHCFRRQDQISTPAAPSGAPGRDHMHGASRTAALQRHRTPTTLSAWWLLLQATARLAPLKAAARRRALASNGEVGFNG